MYPCTCRYNVQCPSEDYDLHYTMVRFDIEPPDNDTCLDYLRKLLSAGADSLIQ